MGGGGSAGHKLAPQEASAASNGANRLALMVSIDLQQAGRGEGQLEPVATPLPALEAQRWPEEGPEPAGVLRMRSKTDGEVQRADSRPEVIKQRADTPQKPGPDGHAEMPRHKQDGRHDRDRERDRDREARPSSERRSDGSKLRHEGKEGKNRPDTPRKSDSARDGHREERHRDRDRDKDRDRERERDGDSSRVRRPETPKSSDRHERRDRGERDREKDRRSRPDASEGRNRERERDRDRRSPEQRRERADSPRVKQERDASRPRPDRPGGKDADRRSGGGDSGKSRPDSNKQQQQQQQGSDTKPPSEFPSYLLGGQSGALKNFVIPKLKRDKDGNVIADLQRAEGWSEPRVKLERIGPERSPGLDKDLKKGPKPVVVLQKLSLDEVQKIIRKSKSRPSFGKSSKGNAVAVLLFLYVALLGIGFPLKTFSSTL